MNIPEMYRILFAEAVEKQNVDFAAKLFHDCTESHFDAKEILEVTLKNRLIEIAKSPNLTTTQHFIEFAIKLAKKNLIRLQMPALLISDIMDITPVDKCEDYFDGLLQNHMETFTDTYFKSTRNVLLRLCNNLLARLSTVDYANFRAKISIFVSIVLPYDRSGCNVDKQYNTEYLLVKSENSSDRMNALNIDPSCENFKLLQSYLREPEKCITKKHWHKFLLCTTNVLKFFLENQIQETQGPVTRSPISGKVELTDFLLKTSVYTCKFRRQILVQVLIVYQHLNSIVLNKEQLEAIQTNTVTIHQIIEKTPPDGQKFLTYVKKILESEERWSAWKNAGCPERTKPESTKIDMVNISKKRQLGDILKEMLEKNKDSRESPQTNAMDDLMTSQRNFLPTLPSYLHKAAEELKPESTVPENDKKIYDGNFGWKALRLMATRSNRFYDYSKGPMANKADFLKMMILRVLDAERDSATVTDNELSNEATVSTIQIPITNAEFEALFGSLGDDWKLLAKQLGFTDSEIESIQVPNPTPSRRASCILRAWFEGPNNPSIEYFCSVMDAIGHPEISKLIRINYLEYDMHEAIEKSKKEIEEKLKMLDVQETSNSPKCLIDDDPSALESTDSDTMA